MTYQERYYIPLLATAILVRTIYAGDIGGEIANPPCRYDASGAVVLGPAQACGGPPVVSIRGGSASVLSVTLTTIGTKDNPWTIVERISGGEPALRFEGGLGPVRAAPVGDASLKPTGTQTNPVGSGHVFARSFSLRVINNSPDEWNSFDLSLQTVLGQESDDEGLSFGESKERLSQDPPKLFEMPVSDKFPKLKVELGSSDSLHFDGGLVKPGEEVEFKFLISESLVPRDEFFLFQRPGVVQQRGMVSREGILILGGVILVLMFWGFRRYQSRKPTSFTNS